LDLCRGLCAEATCDRPDTVACALEKLLTTVAPASRPNANKKRRQAIAGAGGALIYRYKGTTWLVDCNVFTPAATHCAGRVSLLRPRSGGGVFLGECSRPVACNPAKNIWRPSSQAKFPAGDRL